MRDEKGFLTFLSFFFFLFFEARVRACVCKCVYLNKNSEAGQCKMLEDKTKPCHLQIVTRGTPFSVSGENISGKNQQRKKKQLPHLEQCTIPRAAKQLPDRARRGEDTRKEGTIEGLEKEGSWLATLFYLLTKK